MKNKPDSSLAVGVKVFLGPSFFEKLLETRYSSIQSKIRFLKIHTIINNPR